MDIEISPRPLCGKISAPPSKSYAHRYIIAAFLSGRRTTIAGAGSSADVLQTVAALSSLGGSFEVNGNDVLFSGRSIPEGLVEADCNESGSTLRFLLPIAAALGIKCRFSGKGRLMKRPVNGLIDTLNAHGAQIEDLTVGGKLFSGKYVVDATVSSQYITGLMLALPLLDGDSEIVFEGSPVSADYLAMTEDVLVKSGIRFTKNKNGYLIRGGGKYLLPDVAVEGDYSGAAFFLSAGAIGGDVTVNGLNTFSVQGDAGIVDVLARFGAKIERTDDSVEVSRGKLVGTTVDVDPIPDLAQIIAVVAAFSEGESVLKNVSRLKLKESDRLKAIIDMLSTARVRVEIVDDDLKIYGDNEVIGGLFYGADDHRTMMSASILATYAKGRSKIVGAESHKKSYPDFLEDLRSLGGETYVVI